MFLLLNMQNNVQKEISGILQDIMEMMCERNKYSEAVYPVFGNNYNVTNKEAFYAGIQRAEAKEKQN